MFDTICTRTVMKTHLYDACYDYYKNVLQMPIFTEYKGEGRARGCCFGTSVWGVEIIDDADAPRENEKARGAFDVADIDAFRADVATRYGREMPAIVDEAWSRSMILAAPDGYRIKFFTRKPRG